MDAPLFHPKCDVAGRRRCGVLVIGYGNDLRGDDGAGLSVAQRLAEVGRAARVVGVRQLVPELAVDIAAAACVVFVDVYAANDAQLSLRIERIERIDGVAGVADGEHAAPILAHRVAPAALLALAARLYRAYPDAWLLAVPAFDFALGATISPQTARCIDAAIAFCRTLPRTGYRDRAAAQRRRERR